MILRRVPPSDPGVGQGWKPGLELTVRLRKMIQFDIHLLVTAALLSVVGYLVSGIDDAYHPQVPGSGVNSCIRRFRHDVLHDFLSVAKLTVE